MYILYVYIYIYKQTVTNIHCCNLFAQSLGTKCEKRIHGFDVQNLRRSRREYGAWQVTRMTADTEAVAEFLQSNRKCLK